MNINSNFLNLYESYLFAEVSERVAVYQKENPGRDIIRLSIGDVTQPLVPAVIAAMQKAVLALSQKETFHGYGPEETCYGYPELLEAVQRHYRKFHVSLKKEEIFVSDGAKSDLGNLSDLFSTEARVLLPDPVYPAYADVNLMAGRKLFFLNGTAENGFLPMPDPSMRADLIYLCSPNNPTGSVYSESRLEEWVDFARRCGAVILFDAAYESFLQDEGLCHSIYQIEGAKECAIEIGSFSKTAGFTGVRCGYTIVPLALSVDGVSLNRLFKRRQTTKFNGASYISQMGAAAAFSEEGEAQLQKLLEVYRQNARVLSATLDRMGIEYTGGRNSPYLWMKCPNGMGSWQFFDELLRRAAVVGTPGSGFGKNGEGYFRFTAFGDPDRTEEACRRIEALF